jgi:hypothetical protein
MNDVAGVMYYICQDCITCRITLIVVLLDYDFAVSEAQNREEWSGRCHFGMQRNFEELRNAASENYLGGSLNYVQLL